MAIDPVRSLILRWGEGEPSADLMRALGPRAVLLKNEGDLPKRIEDGLWPGVNRAAGGSRRDADEVASASREPWVNANGFKVHCHRALHPNEPALLDYKPDAKAGLSEGQVVAFESLELVLADARANGGNAVLTPDQRMKDALKAGDAKAVAAWNALARTAQWFDANAALFGRPAVPIITAVYDGSHETEEFANMLFRRGGSPRVVALERIPKPDPRVLVVSAAGVKETTPALLDQARAGATVVIDAKPGETWKKVKPESDRDFYALGKGQVLAYREPVLDPSEYALDVIDVATYRRRAARIWNAGAGIPLATEGTSASETLLIALNYGSKVDQEVQVRVQGLFAKAMLLRPEAEPMDLKIYKRGTMTEVFLPSLTVVAAIRFLR